MNKFFLVSNIVLIVAVAILFYLFTSLKSPSASSASVTVSQQNKTDTSSAGHNDFRIAYFELDSVEAKYKYYKSVTSSLESKQKQNQKTLDGLQRRFNEKLKNAQEKSATMSQNEQVGLQKELENMQREFAQKSKTMEEDFMMESFKRLQGVNERIQVVAKKIAEEQGYSYVLSRYENGGNNVIYYRDKNYDITSELIKRLNEAGDTKK